MSYAERLMGLACLTALLTGHVSVGWADETEATVVQDAISSPLRLNTGWIDPESLPNLMLSDDDVADNRPYVVQFEGPMTRARRTGLESIGIDLSMYLPDHAYLTRLDSTRLAALRTLDEVRWIGEYQRDWKLAPDFAARRFVNPERQALRNEGKADLQVSLFPWADIQQVAARLNAIPADVRGSHWINGRYVVHVIIASNQVGGLVAMDEVHFVEHSPELIARNDTNEWIVQSNVAGFTPVWEQGIRGDGQVGGLIDWPVNTNHCSFSDSEPIGPTHRKVVAYRGASGSDTHGTHVCGSFVGDSGTWGLEDFRDGIALAAKVSFSNVLDIYPDPGLLFTRLSEAHADGARAHSNSWGDDGTTSYTTWCEQIDDFTRQNEDDLVVFAVTNLTTLKTPENAKNVLAVGGTSDTPNQMNHCKGGTGPTSDGRRKPEVFAPGCSTQSSSQSTSCSWLSFTGTSMAAPVVTGSGLLVRQYFTDGFYPSGAAVIDDAFTPTGALLKAILINSAADMTGVTGYPSDKEGWGRLLIDAGLYFAGEDRYLVVKDVRNADGLATGESASYALEVVDTSEPLRVTLVWTDVPALVGATFAPINNLDLVVTAPDGNVYLGNQMTDGQSQTGGSADAVNNVEQVHLLLPQPGEYVVDILATAVNQDAQGFALVATGTVLESDSGCEGDVNGDGLVDPLDVGAILSRFCSNAPCDPQYDVNSDGVIDPLDAGFVLSRMGTCL